MARIRLPAVLGVLLCGVIGASAHAQFGFYTLPQNDFTWTWGDFERRSNREDLRVSGSEAQFRCELTAQLRPSSQLSTIEMRQLATELQTSLQFVRSSVELMNALDYQRELEWGMLACKEPPPETVTEEQRIERESKARERMQREVERRRARQQRDSD